MSTRTRALSARALKTTPSCGFYSTGLYLELCLVPVTIYYIFLDLVLVAILSHSVLHSASFLALGSGCNQSDWSLARPIISLMDLSRRSISEIVDLQLTNQITVFVQLYSKYCMNVNTAGN